MSGDLISRSAVIKVLEECNLDKQLFEKDVFEKINSILTIEAVPVVHGYNDNQNFHEADEFKCSVCGLHLEDWSRRVYDEDADDEYWVEYAFKYCPNCGAKMKGGTE